MATCTTQLLVIDPQNDFCDLPASHRHAGNAPSLPVAGAHADMQLRDQLRGIIDNAHRQGLQVIGQQIEDPQAAAAMWMGGVDFIQGNLVQAVGSELGFDFHNAVL